jgi:hypothetical protein
MSFEYNVLRCEVFVLFFGIWCPLSFLDLWFGPGINSGKSIVTVASTIAQVPLSPSSPSGIPTVLCICCTVHSVTILGYSVVLFLILFLSALEIFIIISSNSDMLSSVCPVYWWELKMFFISVLVFWASSISLFLEFLFILSVLAIVYTSHQSPWHINQSCSF